MQQIQKKDFLFLYICAREPDRIYMIGRDERKEQMGQAHYVLFVYREGQFRTVDGNYNANDCTIVDKPSFGLLTVSQSGEYTFETKGSASNGNIFKNCGPPPERPIFGDLSNMEVVAGTAYLVGLGS